WRASSPRPPPARRSWSPSPIRRSIPPSRKAATGSGSRAGSASGASPSRIRASGRGRQGAHEGGLDQGPVRGMEPPSPAREIELVADARPRRLDVGHLDAALLLGEAAAQVVEKTEAVPSLHHQPGELRVRLVVPGEGVVAGGRMGGGEPRNLGL